MKLKTWHPCRSCGKTLSSSQCLWRHKKTCTGSGLHHTNSLSMNKPKIKFHNLNEVLANDGEPPKKNLVNNETQSVKDNSLVEMDKASDS